MMASLLSPLPPPIVANQLPEPDSEPGTELEPESKMNPLRKLLPFRIGRFVGRLSPSNRSMMTTPTTNHLRPFGQTTINSQLSYHPNGYPITTPIGTLPKVLQQSSKRWTKITLTALFLLFLYLASNSWPPLFNSIDGQHRVLYEKLEHGHMAIYGGQQPKRLMPAILARPLKHSPESLKLLGINNLTEMLKKNFAQIKNRTISEMSATIVGSASNCTRLQSVWQSHRYESHQTRLKRLRWMCSVYGFYDRIFTYWKRSSNRQSGNQSKHKYCSTLHCPLLVDDPHRVITCFVQKVASTTVKQLFLRMAESSAKSNETQLQHHPVTNLTEFHQTSNEQLFRVSPMYLHNVQSAHYFKSLFVRHPFVRLVSAFKDKAERGPDKEPYFYAKYWYPLMDQLELQGAQLQKLQPDPHKINQTKQRDPNSRVTFRQFVDELLLKTDPYQYDEHWAPIWTRCEPCYMHYNFIGKLETSDYDFGLFKSRINDPLLNETIWENQNKNFTTSGSDGQQPSTGDQSSGPESDQKQCQLSRMRYAETSRYLAQLSPESIIELYRRYYLDFELFGYTLEELFDTGYYS